MKFLYSFCLLFFAFSSFVLSAPHSQSYKFRLYLSDKGQTSHSLDAPSQFLSRQSIERKERQGVDIDESDLPISKDYFTLVEQAGGKVVAHSKWFGTLVVELNDSLSITHIKALSFVDSVKYVWRGIDRLYSDGLRPRLEENTSCEEENTINGRYGATEAQFRVHNADYLADAGYRGKGIMVGVIDAGFTNYDVIPRFETVSRILYPVVPSFLQATMAPRCCPPWR